MKKLAIIGASYLQEPLIRKAKDMGIETHVFAWAADDVGEKIADHFYPISIIEKEEILEKCRQIGIDGICSIASDLAVVTVNYVAEKMGLVGNGLENTKLATNKHNMRKAFEANGDPSPKSIMVEGAEDVPEMTEFPVIVKPLDRSGSRGVFKVYERSELDAAIQEAKKYGFIKKALVEDYAGGKEYSVECISFGGEHHFLAVTYKYTTGSPYYVEMGHFEPAELTKEEIERIKTVVFHALDTLKIRYGASHSEIKIDKDGDIKIIEIGARMGGDCIGSSLVEISTGIDYVKAVIDVALGKVPDLLPVHEGQAAGIRYICSADDIEVYQKIKKESPNLLVESDVPTEVEGDVVDSSSRFGYFILQSNDPTEVKKYMPNIKVS